MGDDDWGADDAIPVAELSDEGFGDEGFGDGRFRDKGRMRVAPGARRPRRVLAIVVAVGLVGGGAFAARVANTDNGARRRVAPPTKAHVRTIDDGQARLDVASALNVTTASGSFDFHFQLRATPAAASTSTQVPLSCVPAQSDPVESAPSAAMTCGFYRGPDNVVISGDGAVIIDPTVLVDTSKVPGFGAITTRVDGTNVWEFGGGNYGTGSGTRSGAPLSGFAGLVAGTLGAREGAIAMSSMASPTGYLDLAEQAITGATALGDTTFAGIFVHQYQVDIDSTNVQDRPDLTPEEVTTRAAAVALLKQEGYQSTTVTLAIDGRGFIRRAQTVVRFADGGTVEADTTFSDFGCPSAVASADGPIIFLNPAHCAGYVVPPTPSAPTFAVTTTSVSGSTAVAPTP